MGARAPVAIIMGSQSDWPTLKGAADNLDALGVAYEKKVVSAHRTPDRLYAFAKGAKAAGFKVIIAGAGGAAHLPGMTASLTELPVLGVPVMSPAGGHAVYLDGAALLPHVSAEQFPAHAVACALYAEAGVRTCEVGSLMFPGRPAGSPELTRLAIPWRTYTASHLDYVAEALGRITANAKNIGGLRIVSAPAALRHFRAVLAPL